MQKSMVPESLQGGPLAGILSAAATLGNFNVTSGTLPKIDDGVPVSEDPFDQLGEALDNMLAALEACGSGRNDLAFVFIGTTVNLDPEMGDDAAENYAKINGIWNDKVVGRIDEEGVNPLRFVAELESFPLGARFEVLGISKKK